MNRHEERKERQYWIDPAGTTHRFTEKVEDAVDIEDIVSIHFEIAHSILPEEDRPEDILMSRGWILMGSTVYNCPIIHKEPTQGQLDALYDVGQLSRLCFLKDGFYLNYLKEQDKL